MSKYFVASSDELRLLTKMERDVYEMYRCDGKTREEICVHFSISKETFRSHWSRAVRKIEKHRLLLDNPLAFLREVEQKEKRDIFRGDPGVLQKALDPEPVIKEDSLNPI